MYTRTILLILSILTTVYSKEVEINPFGDIITNQDTSSSSLSSTSNSVPTLVTIPWSSTLLSNFTRCTIPRISDLTIETFQQIYKGRLPVIYSRPLELTQTFRDITTYSSLLSNYGQYAITLASSNSYSHDKYKTNLQDYLLNNMKEINTPNRSAKDIYYWFGDDMDEFRPTILNIYPLPLDTIDDDGLSVFGVGNQYSSVAFHTHGAAHAEVIHGRKRWYVSPPSYQPNFNGDNTHLHWIIENTPIIPNTNFIDSSVPTQNKEISECTVEEGEIIYIPPNWWHATFNLDEYNVFVSVFTLEPYRTDS